MKKYIVKSLALLVGLCLTACSDEMDYSPAVGDIISEVTTGDAVTTAYSAVTTGTVKDLSEVNASSYTVGVVYADTEAGVQGGTKVNGTINDNGTVTSEIKGLTVGKTYYYAQFVTLQGKVTKYGTTKSFTCTNSTVTTLEVEGKSATKVTLLGKVADADDILSNVECGFILSDTEDATGNNVTIPVETEVASFSKEVSGLLPGKTYYYTAYTKIGSTIVKGNVQRFTMDAQVMEYVDLGLSVLWAKCNIGAETETEAGAFIGYGDQSGLNYSSDINAYTAENISATAADIVNGLDIEGESNKKSSTPTEAQVQELLASTTQTVEDGGIRFTAANGNSIFLPFAGYREGEVIQTAAEGFYWTGEVSTVNNNYVKTLHLSSEATVGVSLRSLGLSVRTVRKPETAPELAIDNSKLKQGDFEGNGNYRLAFYNPWDGSNSTDDPCFNPSDLKFGEALTVVFEITGIGDAKTVGSGGFADGNWSWAFDTEKITISGDGEYSFKIIGNGSGVNCWYYDLIGLSDMVGAENINVTIKKIVLDFPGVKLDFDNSKLFVGDFEDNGNLRIDTYNPWDDSGSTDDPFMDVSQIKADQYLSVTFKVAGLTDDATCDVASQICDGNWDWYGAKPLKINGNGVYTVTYPGTITGANCWYIDLPGIHTSYPDATVTILGIYQE